MTAEDTKLLNELDDYQHQPGLMAWDRRNAKAAAARIRELLDENAALKAISLAEWKADADKAFQGEGK